MAKKTKYLGYESGKSSSRWFTPKNSENPQTGDGKHNTYPAGKVRLDNPPKDPKAK